MLNQTSDLQDVREFIRAPFTFVQVALPNCGPCQEMKKAIEVIQSERQGIEILVFELPEPTEAIAEMSESVSTFLSEFKVASFPTFLFCSEGKAIRRWGGFFQDGEFESKVERMLDIIDSCELPLDRWPPRYSFSQ